MLDEVHFLIEEHGYRRFALTGSSARKLRRGQANLLAGRAVVRNLLPLTSSETNFTVPVESLLQVGGTRVLPLDRFLRLLHAGEIIAAI